jgi:hypothetical protein
MLGALGATGALGPARQRQEAGMAGIWTTIVTFFRAFARPGTPVPPVAAPAPALDADLPYPTVEAFRRHIFEDYAFTPEARRLLADVELVIHNLREPVGGGWWYGPEGRKVELMGIQDEAAIHEFAHAWADFAGFYDEVDPNNGVPWPTLNRRFRADVQRGALEEDPRYARITRLCRDYEFGNAELNFPGMFENDSERFAGLASGSMGDLLLMPPYIRRWYTGLFLGTRGAGEDGGPED